MRPLCLFSIGKGIEADLARRWGGSQFRPAIRAGFSLVELMIVVAIIGLLASMALPSFNKFLARAKMSEYKGYTKQVQALQESRFQETGCYWPQNNCSAQAETLQAYLIGQDSSGPDTCNCPNAQCSNAGLGFKVTDCRKTRYLLRVSSTAWNSFYNVGVSERTSPRRTIFPGATLSDCPMHVVFFTVNATGPITGAFDNTSNLLGDPDCI